MRDRLFAFLANQFYLFQGGVTIVSTPVGIINSSLLIIAASEKLKFYTGIARTRTMILIAAVSYFVVCLVVGNLLDRFGFWRHLQKAWSDRTDALNGGNK